MSKRDEALVNGATSGEMAALAIVLRAMRHAKATNVQLSVHVDAHFHGDGATLFLTMCASGRTFEVVGIRPARMAPRRKTKR